MLKLEFDSLACVLLFFLRLELLKTFCFFKFTLFFYYFFILNSIFKVREESRKTLKQTDDRTTKDSATTDDRISQIKMQLNTIDEKYNQKLLTVCILLLAAGIGG